MSVARRMLAMCDASWEITVRALAFSCVLLLCAFALLADAGPLSAENYATYRLASELFSLPPAVLLLAALAGAVAEDIKVR